MKTKIVALLLCAVMVFGLGACGNNQTTEGQAEGQGTEADEPVVIENMGKATTYEEAPETAVALSYSIAEIGF